MVYYAPHVPRCACLSWRSYRRDVTTQLCNEVDSRSCFSRRLPMLPLGQLRKHQGRKSKGATGHDVSSRSPPDKSHGTPTGYAPSGLQIWVPSHAIGHVPPNCTTTWTYPVQGRHSPTAHMPCGCATHQPDMCRPGVPLTNTRVTIFFYKYYLNAFTVAATFFLRWCANQGPHM